MGLLMPETAAPARPVPASEPEPTGAQFPQAEYSVAYVRSYLLMRVIIGFTGLALPVVLILGEHFLEPDAPWLRGSLSSYYYSGMRDAFVGALVAAGVFLLTYKVFERSLNNVLSVIAGVAAIAVAYFPTGRLEGDEVALTPLQQRLGEETVGQVHHISAGVFIVSLAVITFFFGVQEGRRTRQRIGRRAWLSPRFWRWFHWTCAAVVLGAVGFMVVDFNDGFMMTRSLLVGQIIAVVFFGMSWLVKGLELDALLGTWKTRRSE